AFKPIPFTVGVFFATFAVTAFLFRFFPPRFDSTNAGPRAAARKFPLGAAVFGSFFAAFFFLGFHLFAVRHSFNSFRGELMFAGESAFGSVAAGALFALVVQSPRAFLPRGFFFRGPARRPAAEVTAEPARR